MTTPRRRVTAEDIHGHLTGHLAGDVLYADPDEQVVLGVLNEDYQTGLIEVHEADAYPTNVLGRFCVTVEEVLDPPVGD